MGKPTGFMEWERQLPEKRDAGERLGDYRELYLEQPAETTREQAGRCMDCGVPFCQQGCPLGNLIPDWNDLVFRDRWQDAYKALSSTNNFPEFTGRLCPAPCEAACTLSVNIQPVTIEQIEREIIERAYSEGWVQPQVARARTGRSVGVVGSGPAGMAAAQQLARAGHDVVLYEKSDRIGGLLRYGIPDFKMEKWVIDRRMEQMTAEGVRFETGVDAGGAVSWKELRDRHDALVIAIGAGQPRDLDVPGRDLAGVHFALEFLEQQNREVAGDSDTPDRVRATGRHVVVLGGGDTGSDCVGTSLRHGAASVTQIELMPAPPSAREADNPWPQWPLIYRTSTSHEEGGTREFALMTERLVGDDAGRVKELHAVRVELARGDNGALRIVPNTSERVVIPCDLLVLAMGYTGIAAAASLREQLGVDVTRRDTVAADRRFRTNVPGVYVAGDAYRGASLIVWAISDGREAARTVDADLIGGRERLPTRGIHQPFGGR